MLNNDIFKYNNNDEESYRTIDYRSQEAENKLRLEHKINFPKDLKFSYGVGYQYVRFTNFTNIIGDQGVLLDEIDTKLNFQKYAVFGSVGRGFESE